RPDDRAVVGRLREGAGERVPRPLGVAASRYDQRRSPAERREDPAIALPEPLQGAAERAEAVALERVRAGEVEGEIGLWETGQEGVQRGEVRLVVAPAGEAKLVDVGQRVEG